MERRRPRSLGDLAIMLNPDLRFDQPVQDYISILSIGKLPSFSAFLTRFQHMRSHLPSWLRILTLLLYHSLVDRIYITFRICALMKTLRPFLYIRASRPSTHLS